MIRTGLVVLVLLLAWGASASEPDAAPPNVVIIVADAQKRSEYGFAGHEQIRTHRLDALVAGARLFARGHLVSDQSRPNLASLLTGLHPHQHGIVSDQPPVPKKLQRLSREERATDPRMLESRVTYSAQLDRFQGLAARLAAGGYLGFQAGRWWEAEHTSAGFSHGLAQGEAARNVALDGGGLASGRSHAKPVIEFIDMAHTQGRPFFVLYAPVALKPPHLPPKRLLNYYASLTKDRRLARHWAMCESFDEGAGKLLKKIETLGISNDTLVIFLTNEIEHPESDERHQRAGEGGIETPIAVRWPARGTAGIDAEHPISLIDIAPTVLAAAGLAPDPSLPGIDLLDDEAVAKRKTIHGARYEPVAQSFDEPAASLRARWLIDEEWKLILPFSERVKGKPELYNFSGKAKRKKNLARARPPLVARLTRKLDAWWKPVLREDD